MEKHQNLSAQITETHSCTVKDSIFNSKKCCICSCPYLHSIHCRSNRAPLWEKHNVPAHVGVVLT